MSELPKSKIEQEELWELFEKVCPRLANESPKGYRAFGDTAFSGLSTRKLLARYQEIARLIQESFDATIEPPPTLSLKTLLGWSKGNQWQRRLKEWKPIHEAYKRKQWSDREKAIIERWNNSRTRFLDGVDEMLDKAELMLKHPHLKKTVKRTVTARFAGEQIEQQIVIAPSKWGMRDVAAFYKVALELMQDVVGDRQVMIDRLHSDGYIITDPSAGGEEVNIEEYLTAADRLEELEI